MLKILVSLLVLLVVCQGNKNLRIGTNPEIAPFTFRDSDGSIVGLDIDLLAAVAREADCFQYDLVSLSWNDLFEQVENSQVDLGISAITITDARKETYDFSVPYYVSTLKILAQEGTDITSAGDLLTLNKVVGVRDGTTGEAAAERILGSDNANIRRFSTFEEAAQALADGEVDAIIDDGGSLDYYAKNNEGLEVIEDNDAFENEFYGVMFPKGSELKASFDEAITAVLKSGEYSRIYSEWFGVAPNVDLLLRAGEEEEEDDGDDSCGEKNLRIGTNPEIAPFTFRDSDGSIVGLDIDLLAALAQQGASFHYELVSLSWNDLFEQVENSQVDLGISAITITDARKETYDFSVPYYVSNLKILAQEGTDITSAGDLLNKVVGVRDGTTGEAAAERILGNDNANIRRFSTFEEAAQALADGEVDAIVDDGGSLDYYAKNNQGLEVIEDNDAFENEFYGVMFPKGSELKASFDKAITAILKSGEYARIYSEWFGVAPDVDLLLRAGKDDLCV